MIGKRSLDEAKRSILTNGDICWINLRLDKSNLDLHFFCMLTKNCQMPIRETRSWSILFENGGARVFSQTFTSIIGNHCVHDAGHIPITTQAPWSQSNYNNSATCTWSLNDEPISPGRLGVYSIITDNWIWFCHCHYLWYTAWLLNKYYMPLQVKNCCLYLQIDIGVNVGEGRFRILDIADKRERWVHATRVR